jgi:predicted acylesterase/phospholipase RssA
MIWASRNTREEEKLADVAVQVNAKGIALYDLSKSRELLRRGKKAAEEKLPQIRAMIYASRKQANLTPYPRTSARGVLRDG